MLVPVLCVLAIVLPGWAAIAAPRRWWRMCGVLFSLLAGFAIRLSDGPQVFACEGDTCPDDARLAMALAGGAVLVALILLARWVLGRHAR